MSSKKNCDCHQIYRALNNAIVHIDWLSNIREAAEAVVHEYHLQWPAYRLKQAIEILEINLKSYANFTSNNEQSRISLQEMPDLLEPREGG